MVRRTGRAPRSERHTRSDRTPVGISLAVGMVAATAALMVAAVLPASSGLWRLAPVAGALFVIAVSTVDPIAVVTVTFLSYLLVIGFLVNQFGVLSWHGSPDLYRLLVLAAPAGAGLVFGAVRRRVRQARPLTVPPEWSAGTPPVSRALTFTHKKEFPGG